ncbi:MAG: alpha/beta hydrolase [Labilithrix sp.]|nr:alpha/beta hydrolase [Labilithrix sp.]
MLMMVERDGIRLAYEEAGTGATTVLLIHGWGTDRKALKPQFDFLASTHRVLSVDLRGFGESSAPEQPYTIEGYADDLAFLAEHCRSPRCVVIGHSMGGPIALDLAARYPDRVIATVVLETFVASSERVLAGLRELLGGLRAESYRDFAVRLMTHLLGPRFDPEERARMLAVVASCPQHVLVSAFEGMLDFDSRAVAARVRGPLLYVGTDTPYADEQEFRHLCPQLVTERLADCGHYFPLEATAKVNAMLTRFLLETR